MKYNKILLLFVTLFALSGCGFINNSSSSSDSTTPEHSHNYNYKTTTIEPTCEEDGYTIYECDCGDTYTSDYVPSTGHNYGEWYSVSDATCTEDGEKRRDCENQNCDHYEIDSIGNIGHKFKAHVCMNCGYNWYTEGLTFKLINDEYYIVSEYTGDDYNVVIPAIYNNKSVKKIAYSAFYNNSLIRSIYIIDGGITSIESNSFQGCCSLESIFLPDSLTSIGDAAFAYCSALQEIDMPNSISKIGDNIFYECNSLVMNELRDGLYVGNDENPYIIFIGLKDKTVETYDIHDDTRFIYTNAFKDCTNIKNIIIPNEITSIGHSTFYNCSSLESIIIPNNIRDIRESTFYACYSLYSITLPINLESIGDLAFGGCESIKSINIPETVINIGSDAFAYCSALEEINIPNSVKILEDRTFVDCENLTSIVIPEGVESIGDSAFEGCSLKEIILPDSLISIGDDAFCQCDITEIIIPKNVKNIGKHIFRYCDSLNKITVDSNNDIYDSRESCNAIIETKSNTLINGCGSSIIPETVSYIGDYAFYCCSLENVDLPNSVIAIGDYAFGYCVELTVITIPETVTELADYLFYGCCKIEKIILHNNIVKIGSYAFFGVGDGAYNDGIESTIYYLGTDEDWNMISIEEGALETIYGVYFYSESEPSQIGQYWHYDTEGNPVEW